MGAAISVRNVSKSFSLNRRGSFVALQDISFEVAAGEFLVLVGPSGCGKTTLLDLIGGLTAAEGGAIHVNGAPVRGPGLDRGIVFQQYALFPWKTALGNIAFGLEAKGVAKAERAARARHYLDLVGLSAFADRYPHQLSGGMKQRVAIARALSYDPAVLLMDEPFAALDAQTRERLQDETLRIWRQTGKTIVFITHSIEEAVYLGQRVLVMAAGPGRVIADLPVRIDRDPSADDLRATPAFVALRHRIWQLIHGRAPQRPASLQPLAEGVA
ncbi:ABC transporter ATP-binding protein [Xanthobacter sp. V4C-4]|uniref:ABC transporter ATP-binding protein n=1 Tax=Xanthobacter cornucopiae TaxID=3119924 RepID=UPI00372ACFB4